MKQLSKSITILSFCALGLMNGEARSESSIEEHLGFGTGAVVGALAGGPVGFIIGAAGGILIGNELAQGNKVEEELQNSTDMRFALESKVAEQEQKLLSLNEKYSSTTEDYQRHLELSELILSSVIDINFNTGSASIDRIQAAKLKQMVKIMKKFPELNIYAAGHTDKNGSEEVNLKLSQKRLETVLAALVTMGVDAERIRTEAFGEAEALFEHDDPEGQLLDRKVAIQFEFPTEQQEFAESSY